MVQPYAQQQPSGRVAVIIIEFPFAESVAGLDDRTLVEWLRRVTPNQIHDYVDYDEVTISVNALPDADEPPTAGAARMRPGEGNSPIY